MVIVSSGVRSCVQLVCPASADMERSGETVYVSRSRPGCRRAPASNSSNMLEEKLNRTLGVLHVHDEDLLTLRPIRKGDNYGKAWQSQAVAAGTESRAAGIKKAAKAEAAARAVPPARIRIGRARRETIPVPVAVMPRPKAGGSNGSRVARRQLGAATGFRRRLPIPKLAPGLNAPGFRRFRRTWIVLRVPSMRRGRDRGVC